MFSANGVGSRDARICAPEPRRATLTRVLSREGWHRNDRAEIIVATTDPDAITVRTAGQPAAATALGDLPQLLHRLAAGPHRCVRRPDLLAGILDCIFCTRWPRKAGMSGTWSRFLADMVLDTHLAALTVAVHRLGPISEQLLRGNAATAMLGAAGVVERRRVEESFGPAAQLARRLCTDERFVGAVCFGDCRDTGAATGYRRTSCCLYYRTPGGGLCADCALITKPRTRTDRKDPT